MLVLSATEASRNHYIFQQADQINCKNYWESARLSP